MTARVEGLGFSVKGSPLGFKGLGQKVPQEVICHKDSPTSSSPL